MPEPVLPEVASIPDQPAVRARIVVLLGHPNLRTSRVNRRMLSALAEWPPADARTDVQIRDVYSLYPDYSIDVPLEQSVLQSAQLIVLQHPMYWYSMPALLKLYVDEVFMEGWAYGEGGQALAGKDLWLAVSAGSGTEPRALHPNRRFEHCLPPYRQTAEQCGMRFLPPFVLHTDLTTTLDEVERHAQRYAELLQTYPAWASDDASRVAPPSN